MVWKLQTWTKTTLSLYLKCHADRPYQFPKMRFQFKKTWTFGVTSVDTLHNINSEVELLIPEALQPIQIIGSQDGGPYASKVALGWVINGPIGRKFRGALHASFFTQMKVHPMYAVCTNFIDASDSHKEMSRDDLQFMNIVETSVRWTTDNHYEIALPISNSALKMPNNRVQAVKRIAHLRQKFQKHLRFCEDYTNFMTEIIQKGYARRIPGTKLNRNDRHLPKFAPQVKSTTCLSTIFGNINHYQPYWLCGSTFSVHILYHIT